MDNGFPAWNSMSVAEPERIPDYPDSIRMPIRGATGESRPTRREIEFEPGLTLGQLITILRGFVAQHPNPDEDARPVTAKVRSNGELMRLEIWER